MALDDPAKQARIDEDRRRLGAGEPFFDAGEVHGGHETAGRVPVELDRRELGGLTPRPADIESGGGYLYAVISSGAGRAALARARVTSKPSAIGTPKLPSSGELGRALPQQPSEAREPIVEGALALPAARAAAWKASARRSRSSMRAMRRSLGGDLLGVGEADSSAREHVREGLRLPSRGAPASASASPRAKACACSSVLRAVKSFTAAIESVARPDAAPPRGRR